MPILNWLNRDKTIKQANRAPYRLLEVDPKLSYGDQNSQNLLIRGDNLEALKALLPYYAGKVKCIYIDPPYNTGNAFQHYDDNLEHSIWLSLLYPRINLLYELLAEGGFFCCHIDDSESHYLKVVLDEIFGRKNYHTSFYLQVRYGNKTLAEDSDYQKLVEQCLIYSKGKTKPNKVKEDYKVDKFEWEIIEKKPGKALTLGNKSVEVFQPEEYEIKKISPCLKGLKETWATGSLIKQKASSGEFFHLNLAPRKEEDGLNCLYKVYGIGEDGLGYRYFTGPKKSTATKGKFYSGIPLFRVEELKSGSSSKETPIPNFYDFSGNFGNCRLEGGADFRGGKKPEALLQLVLTHFSSPGDLVLDSFLGSGTTAAVAHKMNRHWIGIEMGEHAETHCAVRLQKVIDGEQGGISKDVNWEGGGGFRFYNLGEAIFDEDGQISKNIKFEHLAAHIWFSETKNTFSQKEKSPLLGIYNGTAYYLLFNGILGDKSISGGNVLTSKILSTLPDFSGPKVIYGETSRLGLSKLEDNQITFKQTPYDIKAR